MKNQTNETEFMRPIARPDFLQKEARVLYGNSAEYAKNKVFEQLKKTISAEVGGDEILGSLKAEQFLADLNKIIQTVKNQNLQAPQTKPSCAPA